MIFKKIKDFLWGKKSEVKYIEYFHEDIIKDTLIVKEDKKDDRDYHILQAIHIDEDPKMPVKVDLRKYDTPIKNQGHLGACTAFAFGSAYESLRNFMKNKVKYKQGNFWDVSELFIYYNERKLMGTIHKDSGAFLRDGCRALYKWGASLERFWPYKPFIFKTKPSWKAYFAGRWTRIQGYYRCHNLEEIKLSLSKGLPVIFGMQVYQNFYRYRQGIYNKIQGSYQGGHALKLVGYDDDKQCFIVRNSWSTAWGDKGYFYISYKLFEKITFSPWVIIPYGWKN